MGIKFKYIAKTLEELNKKKKDFESYLERNLEIGQVRALLNSNKLDNFARNYYEKKLNDPTNTPHPTDIIMHSQNVLSSHGLDIYQSKFEAMTKDNDYLLDQESKYSDYLSMLDEFRTQNGLKGKGRKDAFQIEHDVFLREAILFMRKKNVTSLKDARYFGVTLDKTLIKFDHYETLRKSYLKVIPTFFKPSLLLKKILKYSPIKTEDYLRAFVRTISTPALDDNYSTSKPAIRSVKYFHKMGISDERLIYNCLKEEMFLSNFESKENDEKALGDFIESEINKSISKTTKEIEELKSTQKERESEISKIKDVSLSTNEENLKLEKRLSEMESSLTIHKKELKKLVNRPLSKTRDNVLQLTIDDEAEKIVTDNNTKVIINKNEKLTSQIIQSQVFYWQLRGVLSLLIGTFILIFYLLIFIFQDKNWNFVAIYFNELEKLSEMRKNLIVGFLTITFGILDFVLVKIFWKRLFDTNARKEFEKNKLQELE